MQELFSLFHKASLSQSIIKDETKTLSYKDFFAKVEEISGFLKKKFHPQTKLLIIAQPSVDWLLWDFACLKSGIITIPMFSNSSSETLKFQIEESMPHCIVAQNVDVLKIIQAITEYQFQSVFLIEKHEGYKTYEDALQINTNEDIETNFINEIATVIYTSGTSGNPKGAMITYSNFVAQIKDIQNRFSVVNNNDVALSILPLAHVFQRTITYFYISQAVNIHIVNDIPNITKHIAQIQPSLITLVPRVLEKIYSSVVSKIEAKPAIIQTLLMYLIKKASQGVLKNHFYKLLLEVLVFKKLKATFSKNIKLLVCGGAKFDSKHEFFFHNAKLPVCQGYGMTECSPVISSNSPSDVKLLTVGKPFPSVEVKIQEGTSQILIRGKSVFLGYLNQEPLNSNKFFPTGDVGNLDKDGFLTITGRIKENCKTAYGKFVNLPHLECLINQIPSVENSCIVAEGKPFVTAIIFTQNNDLLFFEKQIEKINKELDYHTQIKKFILSNEMPTPENNIITPSLKIRRNAIYAKFYKEIENIYKI